MPMPGMEAMDSDTEAMVDMVWDTAHMGLDMEVMEDMEDTGPTTLARGPPMLNPRPLLRLNPRLMPGMVDMVAMGLDTEVMEDMVLDTDPMDLDMEFMVLDTDVDTASMVEREII